MRGVCGPFVHRAVDRSESKSLFGSNCSRLGSLSLQASVPDDTVTVWLAQNTSWKSRCFTPEPDSQEPDGNQRMN